MNQRTDAYGGTTENRARFAIALLNACRKQVGYHFPICIKMNGSDRLEGGLDAAEAAQLAILFANAGFDAIEISSYIWDAIIFDEVKSLPPESQRKIRQRNKEAFNLPLALHIKTALLQEAEINIPIMLVGGIYRLDTIKTILQETSIEFCALSRPLIRQPNLPLLWRIGANTEAECVHCNSCTQDFLTHGEHCEGVRCVRLQRDQKKRKS